MHLKSFLTLKKSFRIRNSPKMSKKMSKQFSFVNMKENMPTNKANYQIKDNYIKNNKKSRKLIEEVKDKSQQHKSNTGLSLGLGIKQKLYRNISNLSSNSRLFRLRGTRSRNFDIKKLINFEDVRFKVLKKDDIKNTIKDICMCIKRLKLKQPTKDIAKIKAIYSDILRNGYITNQKMTHLFLHAKQTAHYNTENRNKKIMLKALFWDLKNLLNYEAGKSDLKGWREEKFDIEMFKDMKRFILIFKEKLSLIENAKINHYRSKSERVIRNITKIIRNDIKKNSAVDHNGFRKNNKFHYDTRKFHFFEGIGDILRSRDVFESFHYSPNKQTEYVWSHNRQLRGFINQLSHRMDKQSQMVMALKN